jgi:hypothetical protein
MACPTVGRRSQSINQQSTINQPSSISARNSNPPVVDAATELATAQSINLQQSISHQPIIHRAFQQGTAIPPWWMLLPNWPLLNQSINQQSAISQSAISQSAIEHFSKEQQSPRGGCYYRTGHCSINLQPSISNQQSINQPSANQSLSIAAKNSNPPVVDAATELATAQSINQPSTFNQQSAINQSAISQSVIEHRSKEQ